MSARERVVAAAARRALRNLAAFGEEVRHARTALGLTQACVGLAVGVSQPRVSRVESGVQRNVSLFDASRIAAAVGRDLSIRVYPGPRRPRAWDAQIEGSGETTAVELEMRLYDFQAQVRRIRLKQRDGAPGITR